MAYFWFGMFLLFVPLAFWVAKDPADARKLGTMIADAFSRLFRKGQP